MNSVDLLLIYAFFRSHEYYLNVIKALSPKYRVGLWLPPLEQRQGAMGSTLRKLEQTDALYVQRCQELGATVVEGPCRTTVLATPQKGLSVEQLQSADRAIQRRKTIALQSFAMGVELLEQFEALGVRRFYVWDRRILANKLFTPEDEALLSRFEVVVMGSPYRRHPVFHDLDIDYIIALPTTLLLPRHADRARLLENVLSLLRQMSPTDKVVIKLHNVRDGGNVNFHGARAGTWLDSAAGLFTGLVRLLRRATGRPLFLDDVLARACAGHARRVRRRAAPLSALTPCHNFGVEHFLPCVRKGLITGISSSIWYALHDRLPVFNCDDQPFDPETFINAHTYKSFYVPPCRGRLVFDEAAFAMTPAESREADMVALLRQEIDAA